MPKMPVDERRCGTRPGHGHGHGHGHGGAGGPASPDSIPATPGKIKVEKTYFARVATRWYHATSVRVLAGAVCLLFALAAVTLYASSSSGAQNSALLGFDIRLPPKKVTWGGPEWEKRVRSSGKPKRHGNPVVLVTGAAGFVGSHVALALRKRGDGVVGIDNFNPYYDPALKRARDANLRQHGIFVAEGDINDMELLNKLFELVRFSHIMHMAAQAGNPASYIHSNVAGFVSLLEACKAANPQPAIIWASSSSVPFSETDRTDQPASLYAATKKAGEEFAHTYNHIYGLSMTGLRFFTVYGPWGRPDMAYFSFTQHILDGKSIKVFQGPNKTDLARDFTYIDDVVKGCVSALDTAEPSTGSGGKKRGPAQLRIFNLGNTQPVSVPNLVAILEKHLKVKAKKSYIKMPRNGDVPFTHANVSLAHHQLAYSPFTDLKTGLKHFVKWYQSYYGEAGHLPGGKLGGRSSSVKKHHR
eukprot:SM000137S00449  [mRNA]  locus=s137:152713:155570:- [translate_table: standard]